MNKGIAITFIVLLSIVAIALTGGFIFLLSNNFEFGSFEFAFGSYSNNLIESKTYDSVEEINVDSKAIDVFVEETSETDIKVELYSQKNITHDFILEDGKLNIMAHKDYNTFGLFSKASKLVIKLPKEFSAKFAIDAKVGDIHFGSFDSLRPTIKNSTGDIKITKVEEATIEIGTGDVKVDKAVTLYIKQGTGDTKVQSVDSIEVDAKTGDVKIQDVKNKMNITNTTGDIKVETATINEDSNISNKTGDIKIQTLTGAYIEATNNVGDIKVNNNDRHLDKTITIHTNTGDIRVN